jgi:hypothetical protein
MNAHAPPEKKPLLGGEGLSKLTEKKYALRPILQGWQREAARLFREYWRTGNPKHLCAFVRHVVAMRIREARVAL